ncbi:acyltransferase [Mycobacterium sp. DL99]|uniref:acyltransferase n=1 Tax=Mycobacterium sp. DL99 TaxID=2528957 RepID=UPI001436CAD8|nr:acyltransferase [Mycobacterium sp. DL99]
MIKPSRAHRFDIRCNIGDVIVANLAMHIVFFFERRLDTGALASALAHALDSVPVFAGRMAMARPAMTIRCDGQGVPLTAESSDGTLGDAIRSTLQGNGSWLVDPVNGPLARWGWGPLCRVRVTHLADGATAIGVSWHHAIGDMQSLMHFMNAWAAAASGKPLAVPLIVEDRVAYLDEHLPADGAREPGVRCLRPAEIARGAWYLANEARRQRTLSLYFGEDEIARMRSAYGNRIRLSANDVVCAHVSEALMRTDPAVDRRALAIVVNARNRCGLDPMLIGNIVTTLNVDLRRGEGAQAIAERIRHTVDHFADEHCDMRINQRFLDAIGAVRAVRCVTSSFNPDRWNPLVSNQSSFGVYRLQFEDTTPAYCALLMTLPIAGIGALLEGAGGRGLVFQMNLPSKEFEAASSPAVQQHLHRFRRADDDIPRLHRELHG